MFTPKSQMLYFPIIRKTISKLDGTMPEELPTPKRSLKEIEKGKLKKLN